jgi:hypothetical protein
MHSDASSILSWGKQLLAARRDPGTPAEAVKAIRGSGDRGYTPTQPQEAETTHWKKMELLRSGGAKQQPAAGRSRPATPSADDVRSHASGASGGGASTSAAATAREAELLAKALAHERVRLQQLREMSDRNEQAFRRREGELIATLQKLKNEQAEKIRESQESEAAAVTEEVLSGLEEDLWSEQCALQKLVEDEAAQGAAVVAVADVVNSCDEREQLARHNMLTCVEHIRRAVPLVQELREIALRTPVLMTTEYSATPSLLSIPDLRGLPKIAPAAELSAIADAVEVCRVAGAVAAEAMSQLGTVLREIRRVDGIKQGQLQQQLEGAQSQLDVQCLTIDDVHQALEKMSSDRELMGAELASLQSIAARQRSFLAEAEQTRSAAMEKLEAAQAKKAQRAAVLAERRHELQMVQREIAANEREKQKIDRRIADVKQRTLETEEQAAAVRLEVEDMEAANQQLLRQVRAATAKEQDASRERTKLTAELQDLRDVAQQRTHQIMDLQLRCDVAETELRVAQRDADEFSRRAEAADRAAGSLQRELDESRHDAAEIERETEEARREAADVTKEVRKLDGQLRDLGEELDLARKILLHQEDERTKFLFDGSAAAAVTLPDASPQAATKALEFLGMPQPLSDVGPATEHEQQPKQSSLSQPRQRSRQWRSTTRSASTDRGLSLEAESMPYLVGTHGVATMWGGQPVRTLTLSPERPPVLVSVEQRHYQRDRRALLEALEAGQGRGAQQLDAPHGFRPSATVAASSTSGDGPPPFEMEETDSDVFGSPPSSSAPSHYHQQQPHHLPRGQAVRDYRHPDQPRRPQLAELPSRSSRSGGVEGRTASPSLELPHDMELVQPSKGPTTQGRPKAALQDRLRSMQQRLQQVLLQPR